MQKRNFKILKAKFLLGNKVYSGTVSNLSENGLLLHAKVCLPLDRRVEILLVFKQKRLIVPIRISKLVKTDRFHNTMAVEIHNPPKDYLELLDRLRPVCKSDNTSISNILKQMEKKETIIDNSKQ